MKTTETTFLSNTPGEYHGLDSVAYHAAPGVSQSTLKAFMGAGTPLHFKTLPPKVVTEDMEFGTLVHAAVLEPDKFPSLYYVRPDTYPAEVKGVVTHKKWTGSANYCKEWNAKHDDRIIITQSELEGVNAIQEKLTTHPFFGEALKVGSKEVSFFKRDEETGLLLKARGDLVALDTSTNQNIILDLKKVRSGFGSKDEFSRQGFELGYHLQDASYISVTGAARFIFVCFDDDAPYDVALNELAPDFRALGHKEWRHQLLRFAECVKTNEWPGYGLDINTIAMPAWGRRRDGEIVDEQHAAWLKRTASKI